MKVKFLKYCPWSYRLTRGILTRHNEGDIASVPDIEGRAMVVAEYAKQVKPGRPFAQPAKVVEPEETKIVEPKETKPAARKKPTKKAWKKAGSK